MKPEWKDAALGAVGGAFVAIAFVYAAAVVGLLSVPANDRAFHDYLMAHPEIIVDMTNKLQAQQAYADEHALQRSVDRLGTKVFFDPRLAFVTGPVNAKTTLVEFFDYNCPYCRSSVPALMKFYKAHKSTVRIAFIEFPIKGPQSTIAARAALAARKQGGKYIAFHFALMEEDGPVDINTVMADAKKTGLDPIKLQSDMSAPDIDLAITASHTLAGAAKIDGTPFFIIDGKVHNGALNDAILNQMAKG